ncbi:hypothetical protein VNO77_03308 [Canavalia gladiata]|uniref:Uncharacterized protein n=1 Tax=Canavalia gladiata TaxID=3824 RepID=A0AAN9MUM5_CANGL
MRRCVKGKPTYKRTWRVRLLQNEPYTSRKEFASLSSRCVTHCAYNSRINGWGGDPASGLGSWRPPTTLIKSLDYIESEGLRSRSFNTLLTCGRRCRIACKLAASNGRGPAKVIIKVRKGGPTRRVQLQPLICRAQLMLASSPGRKAYPTIPIITIKP